MFKMIAEIRGEIQHREQLVEAINKVFEQDLSVVEVLYEGADHYIGKAIGALNDGRNPFEGDTPLVDPEVVTALVILSDPDNRAAFNFTPAKFAVLDHVDKSEKVRKFLVQQVARSRTGQVMGEQLKKIATENPRATARQLQKAQMIYSQAAAQRKQSLAATV